MLADYNLKMPGAVYSGEHALEKITDILRGKVKRAAVFTDPGIKRAGLLELPLSYAALAGTEPVIIDRIPAEPCYEQVQEIVNEFWASGADFIIAVGGGSVMDAAKLASVLDQAPDGVRKLLEDPSGARKKVKTMMIPTTAGTGSEATPNSIVAVPEKEVKVGIVNEEMIADYVILDARMVTNLPRKLAAATGVDALAHAIECFTSNKANPFSDLFALEALELIFNNIEAACDEPENDKAKNAMQIAAFYAGAAITASGTTAVHALSYPLGGKYHIPHGISNAMLLAPVMKFNEPACRERLACAFNRIVSASQAEGEVKNTKEKSEWIISRLEHIVKHLDIPTSLKEYGVGNDDLEDLVNSGMDVKRLLCNNMREVKPEDARALYLQILE